MIAIRNLTRQKLPLAKIIKIAKMVLKEEGIRKEPFLSIVFVGKKRMKTLNKTYRGRDHATDVLAFYSPSSWKKINDLGEIFICLDTVKKNAPLFGYSFEKELFNSIIHGVLHLLGYNDERKEERKKMIKKQKHYLELFLTKYG